MNSRRPDHRGDHQLTGHVLTCNRSELSDLYQREGDVPNRVYLLLRDDEDALGSTRCYIGETDVIANRLRSHDQAKDGMDRVVIVTSQDANLTRRMPGSRLIRARQDSGPGQRDNGTAPGVPALPEADRSDMDYFVTAADRAAGAGRQRDPGQRAQAITGFPIFHLRLAKSGVDAQAQEIDGEFTMLAGSKVVASWNSVGNTASTCKAYASHRSQHEQLVDQGSIAVGGDHGVLTRNVVFSSPSNAGAIALGRSYKTAVGNGPLLTGRCSASGKVAGWTREFQGGSRGRLLERRSSSSNSRPSTRTLRGMSCAARPQEPGP